MNGSGTTNKLFGSYHSSSVPSTAFGLNGTSFGIGSMPNPNYGAMPNPNYDNAKPMFRIGAMPNPSFGAIPNTGFPFGIAPPVPFGTAPDDNNNHNNMFFAQPREPNLFDYAPNPHMGVLNPKCQPEAVSILHSKLYNTIRLLENWYYYYYYYYYLLIYLIFYI